MDFNTTIDIIIKDLREAREIIDDLRNYPGVPQLQIELIKSKCKSAEEVIAILKTIKPDYLSSDEQKPDNDNVTNASESASLDTLFEITDETETEPEPQSDGNVISDQIKDQTLTKKPVPDGGTKAREISKEKLTDSNTVADKFNKVSSTFYEQFGNLKNEPEISDVMKSSPITDLIAAIGLNDRFIFIQEIFNGDQDSYTEAIDKLNKVESLADAKAIIMSYTGESEEKESVVQLLALVKRKLPADE